MMTMTDCPVCKGKGEIRTIGLPTKRCAACRSEGKVPYIEVQLDTIIEELRLLRKIFDDRRRKP